ncbi:LysR family transcriptional regulator [Neptunomonas qingdaonensis]|uniref:DNA-binding transcriptional regulator, LysR family n=1 Tax=Neptunomonas qingdaonensis TaxID=1045558 RepID=A0A1I2R0F1_9GAMM|nr:LysR family transcriptional regulator [Neptunomonas qingdaonensis]SFG32989.1 DNA-binding transcriptional regulator, LysR family [Neptunomonas qingdaonensis]
MDVFSAMGVFVRVVDLKSFSMAAAEMGISSSSVSKQVSQLEQHIGAKLLQRTTRRLFVTDVGAAYYEKCQTILEEVEEADNLVSQLQGKPRGVLRIICNMTFGQIQLSKAIPEFMEKYPDVQVDITLDDRAPDLIRDGFDMAIRIADPQLPDSSMIAREISKIPMYICATPHYLDKHGQPETAEDLKAHNCLVFVYAANAHQWTLEKNAKRYSVQVSGDLKANNSLVVRESVLQHRGIANLADFVIARFVKSGDLVKVFPDCPPEYLSIFAIYPDRKYTSPKVSAFIDFFREWLDRNHKEDLWAG